MRERLRLGEISEGGILKRTRQDACAEDGKGYEIGNGGGGSKSGNVGRGC